MALYVPGASRAVPLNDLNHLDSEKLVGPPRNQEVASAAPDAVKDLLRGP